MTWKVGLIVLAGPGSLAGLAVDIYRQRLDASPADAVTGTIRLVRQA